jgi:hypothetical protein
MTPVDTLSETTSPAYQSLKGRIHQDLLNRLNLDRLTRMTRAEAEPEVRASFATCWTVRASVCLSASPNASRSSATS